jgi:hypothetical protein
MSAVFVKDDRVKLVLSVTFNISALKTMCSVGFVVVTGVAVKDIVFWCIKPCSSMEVYPCFTETYCQFPQGRFASFFLVSFLGLHFDTKDEEGTFLRNVFEILPVYTGRRSAQEERTLQ